jgi:hypothetical protein
VTFATTLPRQQGSACARVDTSDRATDMTLTVVKHSVNEIAIVLVTGVS